MTTRSSRRLFAGAGLAAALLAASQARAEMSAEELAKLAQNPVGNPAAPRRPAPWLRGKAYFSPNLGL